MKKPTIQEQVRHPLKCHREPASRGVLDAQLKQQVIFAVVNDIEQVLDVDEVEREKATSETGKELSQ